MSEPAFELYYQPITDLKTGAIRSVEALLRWQHPEGMVLPDTFIPLAEKTGLILKLGAWVLNEACRQGKAWQQAHAGYEQLGVAVNVSVRQLEHPDLRKHVSQALQQSGLKPAHLTLEVTESAVMKNDRAAQAALTHLKGLGVKLAIDDFGTGYSSFSRLGNLDIDVLKIDRAFVGTLGEGRSSLEIVRAISTAAASLGVGVVAEGIETDAQCAALRALPCDAGQGYLFARPLPQAQVAAFLKLSEPWQWGDPLSEQRATSNEQRVKEKES